MFHKKFSLAGTLLLAGAALVAMPETSWAGHGGGGHGGGGGHFGGFSGARVGGFGARMGGFAGARGFGGLGGPVAGARIGGYSPGTLSRGPLITGTYGRSGTYYGHGGYGVYGNDYRGYGRGYGYYGSSGYAGYSSYNYPYGDFYSGYYPSSDYTASSPYDNTLYADTYDDRDPADYVGGTASGNGTYQSFYPPSGGMDGAETRAHFTVNVPADATLWFNGVATKTTGSVRQFDTPPLEAGGRYTYQVWARWNEDGHEVTQRQEVGFTPGSNVKVTFPAAAEGSAANVR